MGSDAMENNRSRFNRCKRRTRKNQETEGRGSDNHRVPWKWRFRTSGLAARVAGEEDGNGAEKASLEVSLRREMRDKVAMEEEAAMEMGSRERELTFKKTNERSGSDWPRS